MNTLSGGRRRRRTVPESVAVALIVAAFVLSAAGFIALVAYRLVEQVTQALGG